MILEAKLDQIEELKKIGLEYEADFNLKHDFSLYIKKDYYKVFLNVINNKIAGFIIGYVNVDIFEIILIYVKKEYRNNGYSVELINYLKEKYNKIILEVSKNNFIAYNLYNKTNFKNIGIRKGYYNGIDAILMEWVKE